jgi:hypothetical protein
VGVTKKPKKPLVDEGQQAGTGGMVCVVQLAARKVVALTHVPITRFQQQ